MILNALVGTVNMIDDILVHGKDKTENDECLAETLKIKICVNLLKPKPSFYRR